MSRAWPGIVAGLLCKWGPTTHPPAPLLGSAIQTSKQRITTGLRTCKSATASIPILPPGMLLSPPRKGKHISIQRPEAGAAPMTDLGAQPADKHGPRAQDSHGSRAHEGDGMLQGGRQRHPQLGAVRLDGRDGGVDPIDVHLHACSAGAVRASGCWALQRGVAVNVQCVCPAVALAGLCARPVSQRCDHLAVHSACSRGAGIIKRWPANYRSQCRQGCEGHAGAGAGGLLAMAAYYLRTGV
jgi:hypothetical protein